MANLHMVVVACAVLLSGQVTAAKGPSAAEVKKHTSQTLKAGSKGAAAECKAACDDSESCDSVRDDEQTKRCEPVARQSPVEQTVVPARSQ